MTVLRAIRKALISFICLASFVSVMTVPVYASDFSIEEEYDDYIVCRNNDSGYLILIDDMADLFSVDEEDLLLNDMRRSSDGGSVVLVTAYENNYGSAYDFCRRYYNSLLGDENGVMFLIDMDTRELRFYTGGAYARKLPGSTLDLITDNVYKKASAGNYYDCAGAAFTQLGDVLEGKRIAAPMKYISNACLAILLALIINYFFARAVSKAGAASNSEIMEAIDSRFSFTNPSVAFLNETRVYSPRSSGSGGGGGGGGGHSSGGHSF
ncbi:MAG: TPM domain-containing protein [Lachnospiraceae bacterium]|nr:TPM domain-containing protein [Lachnospiraceae bacterium]